MVTRCFPPKGSENPLYITYHDFEWGKLNLDERYLYEMLVLETFQSGLSWATILNKRENFRQAFANFNVDKVAKFDANDRQRLLQDKGIIRNRRKIDAAIKNAQVLVQMHQKGQTLGSFFKTFIPRPIINHPQKLSDVPTQTPLSSTIAKAMKKKGFRFVGPTTIYSYLQSVGLINDHLENCNFKYSGSQPKTK